MGDVLDLRVLKGHRLRGDQDTAWGLVLMQLSEVGEAVKIAVVIQMEQSVRLVEV